MLNQKAIFKQKSKSKIFITILCIFGLLFSYSCSCKNRVSDPNETPPNGGLGDKETDTNYIPKTYTATRSGDTLIVVNSDGNGIQQAAKISFQDAKVTSVNVDVGTTGIAADVFKYESGGLTMTAFDGVDETRKKVTATFSLAPNDSRDKLNNPTETVDIEVVKAITMDTTGTGDNSPTKIVGNFIGKKDISYENFSFNTARVDTTTVNVGKLENSHTSTADGDKLPFSKFRDMILTNIKSGDKIADARWDGVTPTLTDTTISFKIIIDFVPELGLTSYEYTLEVDAKSNQTQKGEWDLNS